MKEFEKKRLKGKNVVPLVQPDTPTAIEKMPIEEVKRSLFNSGFTRRQLREGLEGIQKLIRSHKKP